MKTATIPPVRIDPLFRAQMEHALAEGETMASLVETAVRNEVHRREMESEFLRRGMASIQRMAAAGDGISADAMIGKLEAKLAAGLAAKASQG
jgi:hypothetical protein